MPSTTAQPIDNVLIQRLEAGDLPTVEHLLAMGFLPFDTLARTDPSRSTAQPFVRSLWSWVGASRTASPAVLKRLGEAVLDEVRQDPFPWQDRLTALWEQDDWNLWSIDNPPRTGTAVSSTWDTAWHIATQAMALAFQDDSCAPANDPGFWFRKAGQRIIGALAQGMEQPRTPTEKDRMWERLVAHGLPIAAWDQSVHVWSSSTERVFEVPLAWAAKMGAWDMVDRLARAGVNPNRPYTLPSSTAPASGAPLNVSPLALCLQGLVLNHRIDNHRAVNAYRGAVARAMQALLDAGADLDQPSVLMARRNAPLDNDHPKERHHDDERGVFCGTEAWDGSPSVREVLRAWVDHPESHAAHNDVVDGVPVDLVQGWRIRLDNDDLRQSLRQTAPADARPPRPRL